jgi:hypothetical protein
MKIEPFEQMGSDIEWYAVDNDGLILCFTSGGSLLPSAASDSKEDREVLFRFFESMPTSEGSFGYGAKFHELLGKKETNFAGDTKLHLNLNKYWIANACRGLYAFDYDSGTSWEVPEYFLVAAPTHRLHISVLPTQIAELVSRIAYLGRVEGKERIVFGEFN